MGTDDANLGEETLEVVSKVVRSFYRVRGFGSYKNWTEKELLSEVVILLTEKARRGTLYPRLSAKFLRYRIQDAIRILDRKAPSNGNRVPEPTRSEFKESDQAEHFTPEMRPAKAGKVERLADRIRNEFEANGHQWTNEFHASVETLLGVALSSLHHEFCKHRGTVREKVLRWIAENPGGHPTMEALAAHLFASREAVNREILKLKSEKSLRVVPIAKNGRNGFHKGRQAYYINEGEE